MSVTATRPFVVPTSSVRWIQLLLGLICMMAISSPYVCALFTKPFGSALGATGAEIQVTFSILVVLPTV